jgi:hypothetical protein
MSDEKAGSGSQESAEAELAALAPWAQEMVREALKVYPQVPLIEMIDILEYFTGIRRVIGLRTAVGGLLWI